MMALSLFNITPTGPVAPAAPPGVAPAAGAFDLLMPIADPSDPRHETAPDGKQIGKDMPVDATEAPNPLAWLTPPVAPPVSKPLPAEHGEDAPTAKPVAPSVSPQLPSAIPDTPVTAPVAPIVTTAIPDAVAHKPSTAPLIASTVSRPLPIPAGEASPPPPSLAVAASAAPGAHLTPRDPVIAPAVLPQAPPVPAPTPQSSGKSSGATSPRDARDLPNPVSRPEPSVALETRSVPLAPSTTPRIAPAALVFADAIHRAARDDRGPAAPDAATLAAASDIKTHAVAATTDVQHGALDMCHEQWPARMIERIDALRDAANANDTSIRLIPDALGKIDVSLKRDGDTVAVQFTAQQAETRQLLTDAAPKLAELAEARGLKLSQNGADTAGQQQPRQQPTAPVAAAPRRARADDTESTDIRIA